MRTSFQIYAAQIPMTYHSSIMVTHMTTCLDTTLVILMNLQTATDICPKMKTMKIVGIIQIDRNVYIHALTRVRVMIKKDSQRMNDLSE